MELLDDLLLAEPDAEALILGLLRVADSLRSFGAKKLCNSSVNTLSAVNTLIVLKRNEDYYKDHPEDVDPEGEGLRIGEISPSDLAKSLVQTQGNVTQLLRRLGPDLAKRRNIDGRKKAVSLTPKGRKKARSLEANYSEMVGTICSDLSATSIEQSIKTLEKLYLAYLALKALEEKNAN